MLFAILYNEKVIGLFDDFTLCNNMVNGLVNNKFVESNNVNIVAYHTNSITYVRPPQPSKDDSEEESSEYNTTDSDNLINNHTQVKETKEEEEKRLRREARRRKQEYNLKILKQRKERLEERQRMFEVDLNLYNKFKKLKSENSVFDIPELFRDKYEIMTELDNLNNLDCDNFYILYEKKPLNNSWSTLFTGDAKDRELLEITDSPND
jgi:hypothetical protein